MLCNTDTFVWIFFEILLTLYFLSSSLSTFFHFFSMSDLGRWFFGISLLNMLGYETMWVLNSATEWEVYPWVQERQQNFMVNALLGVLALITFAIIALPLSNNHEMGTRPEGASQLRNMLSFVAALLVLPGLLAIGPWRDAKQATSAQRQNMNQLNGASSSFFLLLLLLLLFKTG